MSYLDADPAKPKEELLRDILSAAQQSHMPGLPLRPFGALLVKVGNEASETVNDLKDHITKLNNENAKLQGWVVALAVAALLGTLVQTAVTIAAYVYPPPSGQLSQSANSSPSPTVESVGPVTQTIKPMVASAPLAVAPNSSIPRK